MQKARLTIDFEFPDEYNYLDEHEIVQLIFDEYINYIKIKHNMDKMHWLVEDSKEDAYAGCDIIAAEHGRWWDICQNAKYTIEVK